MNKLSKSIFVFCFLLVLTTFTQAQVGIGTSSPNSSAALDITSTSKGFLPPRIALTSSTDVTTIVNPATGLLVYCTGASSLTAGYYYYNGVAWVNISGNGSNYSVSPVITTSYVITTTPYDLYLIFSTSGSSTIYLPQISSLPNGGKTRFVIADIAGNLGVYPLFILTSGSDTIAGSGTFVLNSDFSAINLISDGNGRWIIF